MSLQRASSFGYSQPADKQAQHPLTSASSPLPPWPQCPRLQRTEDTRVEGRSNLVPNPSWVLSGASMILPRTGECPPTKHSLFSPSLVTALTMRSGRCEVDSALNPMLHGVDGREAARAQVHTTAAAPATRAQAWPGSICAGTIAQPPLHCSPAPHAAGPQLLQALRQGGAGSVHHCSPQLAVASWSMAANRMHQLVHAPQGPDHQTHTRPCPAPA